MGASLAEGAKSIKPRKNKGRRVSDHPTAPPANDGGTYIAGSSTVSMTWITPFDCFTSAMVTLAMLP